MPQGQGIRCAGFLSDDGNYAHCTREEYAGALRPTSATPTTYAHRLTGPCHCGVTHNSTQQSSPIANASSRESVRVTRYRAINADGILLGIHGRRDYLNADGTPCRRKDMWWERHAGRSSNDMPLYYLPALLAAEPTTRVIFVEGEHATDALTGAGVLAVGTMTGSGGTPCDDALRPLFGHRVVLWPDNDAPGAKHMRNIVRRLRKLGMPLDAIFWIEWPEAPTDGGDAADYLAMGGTVAGIDALIEPLPEDMRTADEADSDEDLDDALRNEAETVESEGLQCGRQEAWDDPAPLPDGMPTVDPFTFELLPDALRDWVQDIAERMQVPTDFPAVAAIVVAAAVVGRQVGIYPKKQDDWIVVPNLWGAVVGPPSAMKSPSLAEAMKPLDRLAAEAQEAYKAALADYEIQAMLADARKTARAEKIKKAAKANDESGMEKLAREVVEEPEPPIMRRYKTNDATVEKLGELLLQNPTGLLQFRDELVGWLRTMGKQGHEGDRAFYLESWIGLNSHDVDRIGRGSLHIPAVCLSILGGIQPGPLASYVYDATNENSAGNDGLLQRFQLFVWSDMPRTWRNVDRWPNTEAKNRAYNVYKRLAALDPTAIGATILEGDADSLPALRFSDEAQAIFDEWRSRLEQRLRTEEMSTPLQAHLAKYRSLMPSLALLFHLMDNEGDGDGVSATAALRATAWCEYLESHARRIYVHAENPELERARALLTHLRAGDVDDGTPIRQMYRHHWSHLATPEEMDDAIKTLDAFGWVRIERPEGRQGRPSAKVRLHPCLRRQLASEATDGSDGSDGSDDNVATTSGTFDTFGTEPVYAFAARK